MYFYDYLLLLSIVFTSLATGFSYLFLIWWRKTRAKALVRKHGFIPVLYLPQVGVEDPELRRAMVDLSQMGYVIFNSQQSVVGTVFIPPEEAGKIAGSLSAGEPEQKPRLKLVVSNRKGPS